MDYMIKHGAVNLLRTGVKLLCFFLIEGPMLQPVQLSLFFAVIPQFLQS